MHLDLQQVMAKLREDIPGKKFDVLPLDENVYNFYELVEGLPNREDIDVLFVTGLEYSLFLYEKEKREEGWDSKEIYSYSWRGVPPVLVNLNQQRERFRDNFDICFVFLIPRFAVNYFLQRAPDFFDWRSGLFRLPMDVESLQRETSSICSKRQYWEDYKRLSPEEINWELGRIYSLIDEYWQTDELKADLWSEQGSLLVAKKEYQEAIEVYEKALEIKLDYNQAWKGKGNALRHLGRYEEAIEAYEKALQIEPDYYKAWNAKGNALFSLGRYEEAIACYDKAIEIQPDYHRAWKNKGVALGNLGKHEQAIAAFEKTLQLQPDDYNLWYNKGVALHNLKRYEEALACYDKAFELAIENLQQAINLDKKYLEYAKNDADFDSLRESDRFQELINQQTD